MRYFAGHDEPSKFNGFRSAKLSDFGLSLKAFLNNQFERDEFVADQLSLLPVGSRILDAGAGSQRYRPLCGHLSYLAQDFGEYTVDSKASLAGGPVGPQRDYQYGPIDIMSDIWSLPCDDNEFAAVLCTEVLEHVPYPIATIKELSRVLAEGGVLILTAPSNCLRHFDPYFFTSGFSDRWFERVLPEAGLEILEITPVGDYYRWLAVELARTIRQKGVRAAAFLLPALAYLMRQRPSHTSVATLCMGYHVVARKRSPGVLSPFAAEDQHPTSSLGA